MHNLWITYYIPSLIINLHVRTLFDSTVSFYTRPALKNNLPLGIHAIEWQMQRCDVIYWTGNNGKILNGMWTDHVTGYKFWNISTSYNIEGGSSEVFWIVFCFSVNTEAVPPSSGIVLHETCIKAGLDSLVASFFACFFLSAIIRLISFLLSSAALKNVNTLRIRLEAVKLNRSMEGPYLSVIFFFNSLLFFLFCFRLDLLCCLW